MRPALKEGARGVVGWKDELHSELVEGHFAVLALLIGIVLTVRNARERSINSGPYVLLTVLTGSLGLLAYLARHGEADPAEASTVLAR